MSRYICLVTPVMEQTEVFSLETDSLEDFKSLIKEHLQKLNKINLTDENRYAVRCSKDEESLSILRLKTKYKCNHELKMACIKDKESEEIQKAYYKIQEEASKACSSFIERFRKEALFIFKKIEIDFSYLSNCKIDDEELFIETIFTFIELEEFFNQEKLQKIIL